MTARPRCAESLAVLLDARSGGTPNAGVLRRAHAHAAVCPECAAVLEDTDASRRVQARFARCPGRAPRALVAPLVVLSFVQLAIAVPWLFGHNPIGAVGHAASEHLVRDGAIGFVIAIAGLIAAFDAARARTLCLVSIAALAIQLSAGLFDERDHRVTVHFELTHLLAIAIVVLVALIARRAPYGPVRAQRRPQLRPVGGQQAPPWPNRSAP
jgi:hypothetical protein